MCLTSVAIRNLREVLQNKLKRDQNEQSVGKEVISNLATALEQMGNGNSDVENGAVVFVLQQEWAGYKRASDSSGSLTRIPTQGEQFAKLAKFVHDVNNKLIEYKVKIAKVAKGEITLVEAGKLIELADGDPLLSPKLAAEMTGARYARAITDPVGAKLEAGADLAQYTYDKTFKTAKVVWTGSDFLVADLNSPEKPFLQGLKAEASDSLPIISSGGKLIDFSNVRSGVEGVITFKYGDKNEPIISTFKLKTGDWKKIEPRK